MDHDLHSLLAAARDDAPPPRLSIDDITAAGRQLARRRRRTALLASVAGGIAAVITGATVAAVLFSPPPVGPTADPHGAPGIADVSQSPARRADFVAAGAFETSYRGYVSGRYIVSDPDLVTANYQQSSIDLNSAAPQPTPTPSTRDASPSAARSTAVARGGDVVPREGRLVVYGPGAFNPREFMGGDKAQVDGKTALVRVAGGPSEPPSVSGKYGCCLSATIPTIAWQYLPDAWAAIYWSSAQTAPTRDELIALAEAMPADDPHPFPTGIRIQQVPKNYKLLAVSTRKSSYDETYRSIVRLASKPATTTLTAPIDLDQYPSLVLTLGLTDQVAGEPIGKMSCPPVSGSCATIIGDGQFFLQVESVGDIPLGASEMAAILKLMSADQPDDRSAWPPAVSVFRY